MTNWFNGRRDRDTALWQAGEMDDRAFEAAQVRRVRKNIGLAFSVLLVFLLCAVVLGNWSDHTPIRLDQLLGVSVLMVIFGVVVALRVGGWAKVAARTQGLARNRARAEANPAYGLPTAVQGRVRSQAPERCFGTYKRSLRYAYFVIGLASVGLAFTGTPTYVEFVRSEDIYPPLLVGAAALLGIAVWGLYMVADRRVYLELSPAGVWCRAWGKERHPFSQFKAVYPRQNATKRGIVFVPRNPEEFRRTLSWSARLAFRGGGGVSAHRGTMTLWTTEVGLPRDLLLREVQARVVGAAQRE